VLDERLPPALARQGADVDEDACEGECREENADTDDRQIELAVGGIRDGVVTRERGDRRGGSSEAQPRGGAVDARERSTGGGVVELLEDGRPPLMLCGGQPPAQRARPLRVPSPPRPS